MYRDDFLQNKLNERKAQDAFRVLRVQDGKADFCSNDYLGIAHRQLLSENGLSAGSTGSRLLAGNWPIMETVEKEIAAFHQAEAALLFNSGYDANLGLLSAVPQKGDTIIYDQLSHASIRDGIRLSFAQAYSFAHNDLSDLRKKLQSATGNVFIVTESVFSMDGDFCPIRELVTIAKEHGAHLIIDEAHATGVIGERGEGLVQQEGLQTEIFARIHTFGKAVGCHGAVVLGSAQLRDYLINFARSLIYSTALSPAAVGAIRQAYQLFPTMYAERSKLQQWIQQLTNATLRYTLMQSSTAIQPLVVPGNTAARALAQQLQDAGLDVRPILYPTVPKGSERLRIVLHAFNTKEEMDKLIQILS
ncbi:MAG: 8-amino-7-oxononanoate synthase [Chitinophagales bacterium]|nr:8-amino-7-oxononanoate synthase [Chitinophagales bacterium]